MRCGRMGHAWSKHFTCGHSVSRTAVKWQARSWNQFLILPHRAAPIALKFTFILYLNWHNIAEKDRPRGSVLNFAHWGREFYSWSDLFFIRFWLAEWVEIELYCRKCYWKFFDYLPVDGLGNGHRFMISSRSFIHWIFCREIKGKKHSALRKEVCLISSLETPFVCASRGGRGASTRWNHHLSVHHVVESVLKSHHFCRHFRQLISLPYGVWSNGPHVTQR